ncbi:hypothetical protein EXIGLDRAFT_746738 [Exidia glandulosa HHB12029]|uniref:Uncharacterized protein n=1 Tax=Exidia glandulosa HHB12029 TaxID=1314781 RepID=A0A165LSN1_EXIGL|nr:hypothetical protein EXIGLDRAFT_746738 [Exidia glandulosa HHB12029]
MFAPLFSFAIIALSVVSASPIKRAAPTLPLPSTASLWLQFEFSDTDAFVTFDGLVWQWAGEDEPGPPIAQFAIELVPGSMQPSGTDPLVRLSLAGTECRVVGDFFDCSGLL